MPHHPERTVTGTVTHIFAHRFVLDTADGAILADLTPHGRDQIALAMGDKIIASGEQKPSELKVSKLVRGRETFVIAHPPHKHGDDKHHAPADPDVALKAVRKAGYTPKAEPRRKPKHFEVLVQRGAHFEEAHVELDGHIRKTKPADQHDPKWQPLA